MFSCRLAPARGHQSIIIRPSLNDRAFFPNNKGVIETDLK